MLSAGNGVWSCMLCTSLVVHETLNFCCWGCSDEEDVGSASPFWYVLRKDWSGYRVLM